MKKSLVLLFIAGLTISCGTRGTKTATEENVANSGTVQLTHSEFTSKIADTEASQWQFKGDKPAVIDFYADWCGPCKMIAPVLEELAEKYSGRIDVYKVNVDEETELAKAYGIQSIPTLLFIPMNGEPIKAIGFKQKDELEEYIEKIL